MLDSLGTLYGDHLHLASLAIDAACGHLRDYANATDDPVSEAVEVADLMDVIMEMMARIERKVDCLPEVQS